VRIWLTARKGKASFIYDDNGFRVGTEVKAKIEKSRFGSQGRQCTFKIVWGGGDVHIMDKESWFEAIKGSDNIKSSGAWFTLIFEDGKEEKFQQKTWIEKLDNEKFYNRIIQLMEEEVVMKFDKRQGSAEDFYNIDSGETNE